MAGNNNSSGDDKKMSTGDIVNIATGAVNALSGLTTSLTNISDSKKRRNFEQNLALLDYDEKKKLNDKLLKANSEQARQQLLVNTLSDISKSRITALNEANLQKAKNKKIIIISSVIAGSVLLFAGIFIYIKKMKNAN